MKKDNKSWALKALLWFHENVPNVVVGWIWASNSILLILYYFKFSGTITDLGIGIFCLLIAVVFWNRSDMEIKK